MKQSTTEDKSYSLFSNPVLLGLGVIVGSVLAGSVIITLLLRYTALSEVNLPYFTYGINGISILAGGWLAGAKSQKRGWLSGGLTGLFYVLLIFLIGFLAFDTSMRVQPLLFTVCVVSLSALGGILGINTRTR